MPSSWTLWRAFNQFHPAGVVREYTNVLHNLCYLTRGDSRTQLPFYLIVETPKEKLKYSPRSDFHMCIKNFPHVLVKVNSNQFEYDRYRLLLQASCICRIGNWLRASTTGKPIIIMAVYIDQSYQADQYLVYQPDVKSTKVALNRLTGSFWLMQSFSRLSTSGSVLIWQILKRRLNSFSNCTTSSL